MYPCVYETFPRFTQTLEGYVPWMYLDDLGLVTIGVGNLIDPIQYALSLTLYNANGSLARPDEIRAEWEAVKANAPNAAQLSYKYYQRITKLRMRDDDIANLVNSKARELWADMLKLFPDAETWPADAQIFLITYPYATGPRFRAPRLTAALQARDFQTAAIESSFRDPKYARRNQQHRLLLTNAHTVDALSLDPQHVYWPRSAADDATA